MKFRRKAREAAEETQVAASVEDAEQTPEVPRPLDISEVSDEVERVNLGGVHIEPTPGRELRLQVEESSGAVQSVLLVGEDGAMEFAAFAAPRNGNLWAEARPDIVADLTSRGAEVVEVEGRYGPELHVTAQVQTEDGQVGIQETRIIGVNGPRWLLRASFLGAPARPGDSAEDWEACLGHLVVDRGQQALPVGTPLEIRLPDEARRVN